MKKYWLIAILCLPLTACFIHATVKECQQIAVVPVGAIQVPIYSAVHNPQAQSNRDDVLIEILAELRAMRAELQALRNPTLALTLSNVTPAVRTNCAKCHSAATAEKDGGGFVLIDARGELATLSDRDRQRVVNRVGKNSMPPAPAKIDAKDKAAIVAAFEKK